ncbi:MAG: hypothetical protein ACOY0R_07755 [Chloroflexota bacterium]
MKNKKDLFWITPGLLILGALVAYAFFGTGGRRPGSNSSDNSDAFVLNQFHSIQGTSILVATVEQESDGLEEISARWFNFRNGYGASNLIFLDANTLSSHTLFETNSHVIIGLYQFPSPNFDSNSKADQVEVKWLVYEIAKSDTNSDGRIDGRDLFVVALSDVDGSNYTEVIENVQDIQGMNLLDGNILLLVYDSNGTYTVAKVDLSQRNIIDSKPLTGGWESP